MKSFTKCHKSENAKILNEIEMISGHGFTNLVHQREGVVLVRLLPGVVGEVVEVGQHLRRPVLGPLPGPVVEHVKVVGKEVNGRSDL